jgi:hypothetical protein
VQPKHATTYYLEASGPSGTVKQDATVDVNTVVQSSIEATPAEVAYVKVGNKVLTQESSELKWAVTNADAISVTPIGNVVAIDQEKRRHIPFRLKPQLFRDPVSGRISTTILAGQMLFRPA